MTRSERAIRTPSIILKRRDFGEADRILTILTPQHGKLDVIAKGARKPASSKTGHVELFTRTDMLLHKGRDLDIVAQVEMNAPYLGVREDLARGAYASYTAELVDRFITEGDQAHSEMFTLLDATLDRLCNDDEPRLAVRYFEIHLLDEVGFRPELQECVVSHEDIEPEDQYFSYPLGGVVKPGYVHSGMVVAQISMTALKLLRHMQRSPYQQVKALRLSPAIHDEAERILLGYITSILERKLQSVDFIRQVRSL